MLGLTMKLLLLTIFYVSVEAATKAPKKLDCSTLKLDEEPKDCCEGEVPGPLVATSVLKKCSSKKDVYKWVNTYTLNQLQSAKLNNTFDLKSTNNVEKIICPAARFINCLFSTNNIGTDGTYDGEKAYKLTVFSTLGANDYWNKDFGSMVKESQSASDYMTAMFNKTVLCPAEKKGKPKEKVYIGYMFLVQYLQAYIPLGCKPLAYTKKNGCEATQQKFQDCYYAFHDNLYEESSFGQKSLNAFRSQRKAMIQTARLNA